MSNARCDQCHAKVALGRSFGAKQALELLQNALAALTSEDAREFTLIHKLAFDSILPAELQCKAPLRRAESV